MKSTSLPVMTVSEVAEYLRIPRGSVYKLAQEGRIPCQKVGKHWRFRKEAVDIWLDSANPPRTQMQTTSRKAKEGE